MATSVIDSRATFLDIQKLLGPNGKPMPVAEVLNQVNTMLQDAPITKSNAELGHRVDFRLGLPQISTGKVNQGIPKSKSTTEQHNESMGLFVARSEVDLKHKHILGEEKFAYKRAKDDLAYAEAFSQYVASQLLYGSILADDATFDGFLTRMPNLQRPLPGNNGSQILSNGTVVGGDGTSILVVDWHEDRGCHLIYPEGSKSGGLTQIDYGDMPGISVNDADGNGFQAAVTEWIWNIGLAVEDPRHMGRLANIDISDASLGAQATQAQIIDGLLDVLSLMPSPEGMKRVAYMHPLLLTAFHKQLIHTSSTLLIHMEEYLGKPTPHLGDMPFRRMDQFLTSEGTVS